MRLELYPSFVLNGDGELVWQEDNGVGRGNDNWDGDKDCKGHCIDGKPNHGQGNNVGVYGEMNTSITLSYVEYWLDGLGEIVTNVM